MDWGRSVSDEAARGLGSLVGSLSRRRASPTPDPLPADDHARRALRLVRYMEEQGSSWFWETDVQGCLSYLSPGAVAQLDDLGLPAVGRPVYEIFRAGGADTATERTLRFHITGRTSFTDYEVCTLASPDRTWSISGRPAFDAEGRFQGFVGNGSDLTAKRRIEAEMKRLAMYDPLTGLANITQMQLSLGPLLNGVCKAGAPRPLALFLLDLDRFKAVNDTLGHPMGDRLLKLVADRLLTAVGSEALVARRGGDEFQVAVVGDCRRETLTHIAQAIVSTVSQPYKLSDATVSVGCSIGVAIAPEDGGDAETLSRNADLALYAAKADGRGTFRFYEPALLAQAQQRRQLEEDLRVAIAQQQLHLVYQPVVSTRNGAITGYEALVRWNHPRRGPVSPVEFIPVAEESGLIEAIGEYVLRTATRAAAGWPVPARIAVNVSPIQFARPTLPLVVASALADAGLDPARLELEITESVFLGGDSNEATFANLKALGVRLALDDFGTGYSALGYLKTAPFDKIKIDQSFVRGIRHAGSRNAAIVKAIVTLAEALGLETTAEGVEAQDEIELVRSLGCSHIQGFVYGRPRDNELVLADLRSVVVPMPVGVRVSRPPRTRMLRSIWIEASGHRRLARLRDISSTGAMIDDFQPLALASDMMIRIEFTEGEPVEGRVRWCSGGRAGIVLARSFDFRSMQAGQPQRLRA